MTLQNLISIMKFLLKLAKRLMPIFFKVKEIVEDIQDGMPPENDPSSVEYFRNREKVQEDIDRHNEHLLSELEINRKSIESILDGAKVYGKMRVLSNPPKGLVEERVILYEFEYVLVDKWSVKKFNHLDPFFAGNIYAKMIGGDYLRIPFIFI